MRPISICKSGLVNRVWPGLPQQVLWPWPGPLAGKQVGGGGGVNTQQVSPGTCPSAGAGRGLQGGPGCLDLPTPWGSGSMANRAARGWVGMRGAELGWFPAQSQVGSGPSWCTGALKPATNGAQLAGCHFSLKVCEGGAAGAHLGSPPPPPGCGKGPQTVPHSSCCTVVPSIPLATQSQQEERAEPFICGLALPTGHFLSEPQFPPQ